MIYGMTLNEILELFIENWYIVAPMISSPFIVVYILKLLVVFFGTKKGKEIMEKLTKEFNQNISGIISSTFDKVLDQIKFTEKKLDTDLKKLKAENDAFIKTILSQEANTELLAKFEQLQYQNFMLVDKLNEEKQELKEDLIKKQDEIKNEVKTKVDKNVKKIKKEFDKTKKELAKNVEIDLE